MYLFISEEFQSVAKIERKFDEALRDNTSEAFKNMQDEFCRAVRILSDILSDTRTIL